MREPLDDLYLEWLYAQVDSIGIKNKTKTHWGLLRQLYTKEFIWLVPNDDNRAEDGRDLRLEFLTANEYEVEEDWMRLGCSMLEMLIAMARRLTFEGEGSMKKWFWQLLENLRLSGFNDQVYKNGQNSEHVINEILDDLIWRTYGRDGFGGLFPLDEPQENQRDVELWYQMSAYLMEKY